MWTGKIKKASGSVEVLVAEALVDIFIEPCEQEGVQHLGEIITVVRGAIRIKEDGTELPLDEFHLIRKRIL